MHAVPSAIVGFVQVPVPVSHVPARWHWSLAVQVTAVPPHTPAVHASLVVHPLPSLHAVPFEAVGFEQEPVDELHVPATWHWSLAVHVTGFDPMHTPAAQAYVWSHKFVPVHEVPSVTVGFEQVPLLGLHVPTAWHWSLAVHVTGFEPVQTPVWHVSVCVHAFPSLHVVPFDAVGLEHAPVDVLHVPAVWH